MKTLLEFSKQAKLEMQAHDQGKIYMIKLLRDAFAGIGLQACKKIADPLWDDCVPNSSVTVDLPRVSRDGFYALAETGMTVKQPPGEIPLHERLRSLAQTAIKRGDLVLAEALLHVYNTHHFGE